MKKLYLIFLLFLTPPAFAQEKTGFSQQEVIYGRRDGLALTMTVLTPKKTNGKGIISLISGNWISDYNLYGRFVDRAQPFLKAGYTVFLTMHSSNPRYAIPDAIEDIERAVQFVRFNAAKYKIDPGHIGITGTSSGGHLSLAVAMAHDIMDTKAKDPVAQVSSKVQAVAVFCPPTDFVNFGQQGFNVAEQKPLITQLGVLGAFSFTAWDAKKNVYQPITDEQKIRSIDTLISPAEMVSAGAPPTYMMHGDHDQTVPLQQSQLMQQRLSAVKVPVVLTIKPGADHGWQGMIADEKEFVAWFDKYLQ